MGKGPRNRARREAARHAGLTPERLDSLFALEDVSGLRELLRTDPMLLGPAVDRDLGKFATAEVNGLVFGLFQRMLRRARTDTDGAWRDFADARDRVYELDEEAASYEDRVRAAAGANRHGEVIALCEEGVAIAREAGNGDRTSWLLHAEGLAYFRRVTPNREDDIENAISRLEVALRLAFKDDVVDVLMHLALAYSERLHGDRAENLERARTLLQNALDELGPDGDPDSMAIVRTNLAVVLIRREHGPRVENLRTAVELCRLALTFRRPERNAYDWAHTMLNLGEALGYLAALGEADRSDAVDAYERIIDEQEHLVRDSWLVGGAHQMLGRMLLESARPDPNKLVDTYGTSQFEANFDLAPVAEAREHLERARELTEHAPDAMRRARVLDDLSDSLARLGEDELAIAVARQALTVLRPTSSPAQCRSVAMRLGAILSENGDWAGAAAAYRDAVEANELMFHRRLDTTAREADLRLAGNLTRWAALAVARAGEPEVALLILENGRTRELRRRLGLTSYEAAQLAGLPPELREAYVEALRRFAMAPMDSAASGPARELQQRLRDIRAVPGHEDFGTGVRREDLAAAVVPQWPLIYVNPTPAGTQLLRVATEDGVRVEETFLEEPTSTSIFMRLLTGSDDDERFARKRGSYFFSIISETGSARSLRRGLDSSLPWLGERLAKPIAACARGVGATGITLVLCGPLGLAPIHAAPWRDGPADRCLLDLFDVRYAPSAIMAAAALRRGSNRDADPPTLLALADPMNNLPAARPEVRDIASQFQPGAAVVAYGRDASEQFLRDHAAAATHIHLACHATGGMLDVADAGVELAGGVMPASRLTALADIRARVSVISACQSALSEVAGLPDEAISIATTMLAAGSACSVASLWPVDDVSTAMLMVQFYAEMLDRGRRPPEALRAAQLWLRDATQEDVRRFFAEHQGIDDELRRRGGTSAKGLLSRLTTGRGNHRPFSHPDHWAPFVAVGV